MAGFTSGQPGPSRHCPGDGLCSPEKDPPVSHVLGISGHWLSHAGGREKARDLPVHLIPLISVRYFTAALLCIWCPHISRTSPVPFFQKKTFSPLLKNISGVLIYLPGVGWKPTYLSAPYIYPHSPSQPPASLLRSSLSVWSDLRRSSSPSSRQCDK